MFGDHDLGVAQRYRDRGQKWDEPQFERGQHQMCEFSAIILGQ